MGQVLELVVYCDCACCVEDDAAIRLEICEDIIVYLVCVPYTLLMLR